MLLSFISKIEVNRFNFENNYLTLLLFGAIMFGNGSKAVFGPI